MYQSKGFAFTWLCLVALGLFSGCLDREAEPQGPQTGGITAQVVWPADAQPALRTVALRNPDQPSTRYLVPAGVSTIRAIVSAADIATPISVDIAVTAGDSGTGQVSGVPVGTGRTLTIQGLDPAGTVLFDGVVTGISVTAGQTTDVGNVVMSFVGAPTITATAGDQQITLSWNPVSGATSYNLYWDTAPGVTTTSNQIVGVTSPHPHTGLINGQEYCYRVSAVNAGVEGPLSDEACATPPGTPTILIASPGDGTTNISTTSNILIVFSESMDTSVDPVLGFAPLVTGTVSVIWTSTNLDNDTAVFTLSVALDFGTDYTVTISGAQDLAGNGMADGAIAFRSHRSLWRRC